MKSVLIFVEFGFTGAEFQAKLSESDSFKKSHSEEFHLTLACTLSIPNWIQLLSLIFKTKLSSKTKLSNKFFVVILLGFLS